MNRISELRKKLGLTQIRLGEEIGVSQQTISKYENVDENISGDMLLALSKFFKVPVDYILRKDEEEQQREQDNKREIMELYRDMDQYNRDTWIIIGKRLLGGQLHKYNEDSSKRYLSKSMLFDGRCNRLFFYFQKVYKKVLRYAKIF